MYQIFIHSPTVGHLGCFQILPVMNKADIYISMCMFLHECRSLTSLSITTLLLVPPLSCVGIFLTPFELHLSGTVFLCLFTDGLLWATTVLPSTVLLMVTWLFPTFRTELFRKGTGDRGKGLCGQWSFVIKWAYSNVIYLLVMKILCSF